MRKEKRVKILIMVITFLLIVLLPTVAEAGIESKSGTTTWTHISVSDAYGVCYGMASGGSTLGNCSLDSHLALSKDWGAAAYLAISDYGAVKTATGPAIEINGRADYYTTTGNITGVIDLGKTLAYTASCKKIGLSETSLNNFYRTKLIENKTSRYVDILPNKGEQTALNTRGMALIETSGLLASKASYVDAYNNDNPILLRTGVLGFQTPNYGENLESITFRPVIWNLARN